METNKISRLSNKVCPEGMSIEEWQIALRREQAALSSFTVEHLDDNRIWGDYIVLSGSSRYKVAFRGVCSDRNFCSCLDFRTNGLGTCKHLEAVTLHLQKDVPGYPWAGLSYTPNYTSVYVSYKGGRSIRMRIGSDKSVEFLRVYNQYFNENGVLPKENYHLLGEIQQICSEISPNFRMYDDVLDFGAEMGRLRAWQESLEEAFVDERIPLNQLGTRMNTDALEKALYQLCYASDSLVVAPKSPVAIHLVARLAEEVYEGEGRPQPGYIIVDTEAERKQWKTILSKYEYFSSLAIDVLLPSELVSIASNSHPTVSFVWVDNARCLKDWQNSLSHALKKLSIGHLYMRLETLWGLGPIQLSSIMQHINPFVMGPLYHFVHTYRHAFPLKDDGSNLPKEIADRVCFLPDMDQYSANSSRMSSPLAAQSINLSGMNSEELVEHLLSCFIAIAQDPRAVELLKNKLSK